MPTGNFSIGHDISVDVVDGETGAVITFDQLTNFTAKPITKMINSEPIGDKPLFAEAPNGWSGTFDMDRTSPAADLYFASKEAEYWAGGNPLTGTVNQIITEKDGSLTQFRFPGAALVMEDPGNWKSAEKVTQRVKWTARSRDRIL